MLSIERDNTVANNTFATDQGSFMINMFRDSVNDGLDFLHDRFVDDALPRMSDEEYCDYDEQARAILDEVLDDKGDIIAEFFNESVLIDGDAGIDELVVSGGDGDYVFRLMRPQYGFVDLAKIPWASGMTVEDAEIISIMLERAFKSLAEEGLYA